MIQTLRICPAPIAAATISRDLSRFACLVTQMEAELGNAWADVPLADAERFFASDAARMLRFVVFALDEADVDVAAAMDAARRSGVRVMLVARGVAGAQMQSILRHGLDDLLVWPVGAGALSDAAKGAGPREPPRLGPSDDLPDAARRPSHLGTVIAILGLASGVGTSTLAAELAWELSATRRVCLLEIRTDADPCTWRHRSRYDGLVARPEAIPRLAATTRDGFDHVLVDIPFGAADPCAALGHCDEVLAVLGPDPGGLRAGRRLARTADGAENLRYVINRAPGLSDPAGRARLRRVAAALPPSVHLPDGGRTVAEAGSRALSLAEYAPRNKLRQAIAALAAGLVRT